MSNRTHSAEQIAEALRLLMSGRSVKEVSSGLGVTAQTIYRWKRDYENLDEAAISDVMSARRLRHRSGINLLELFPTPRISVADISKKTK